MFEKCLFSFLSWYRWCNFLLKPVFILHILALISKIILDPSFFLQVSRKVNYILACPTFSHVSCTVSLYVDLYTHPHGHPQDYDTICRLWQLSMFLSLCKSFRLRSIWSILKVIYVSYCFEQIFSAVVIEQGLHEQTDTNKIFQGMFFCIPYPNGTRKALTLPFHYSITDTPGVIQFFTLCTQAESFRWF